MARPMATQIDPLEVVTYLMSLTNIDRDHTAFVIDISSLQPLSEMQHRSDGVSGYLWGIVHQAEGGFVVNDAFILSIRREHRGGKKD